MTGASDASAAAHPVGTVDALKPEDTSTLRIHGITALRTAPDQFFTKEYLESGRLFPFEF